MFDASKVTIKSRELPRDKDHKLPPRERYENVKFVMQRETVFESDTGVITFDNCIFTNNFDIVLLGGYRYAFIDCDIKSIRFLERSESSSAKEQVELFFSNCEIGTMLYLYTEDQGNALIKKHAVYDKDEFLKTARFHRCFIKESHDRFDTQFLHDANFVECLIRDILLHTDANYLFNKCIINDVSMSFLSQKRKFLTKPSLVLLRTFICSIFELVIFSKHFDITSDHCNFEILFENWVTQIDANDIIYVYNSKDSFETYLVSDILNSLQSFEYYLENMQLQIPLLTELSKKDYSDMILKYGKLYEKLAEIYTTNTPEYYAQFLENTTQSFHPKIQRIPYTLFSDNFPNDF